MGKDEANGMREMCQVKTQFRLAQFVRADRYLADWFSRREAVLTYANDNQIESGR